MKRVIQFLSVVFLALAGPAPVHAALDLNADNVPDVWALVYNTGALTPGADADGDGLTNGQEASAGTDPFSPAGTVKITNVTMDIYGVHLFFPAKAGKRYQVQVATALGGVWNPVGAPLAGVDGELEANPEVPGAEEKYYRVVVSDVDTDNDGVTDWEELQLGFNPNNSHSGGSNGPDDLTAITTALTAPSTISVVSIDNTATEPAPGVAASDTGAFVISRTGGLKTVTVSYSTTGSAATAGSDYTALSGTVAFGLGVRSVTIPVVPLEDTAVESTEAVVMSVVANPATYVVGAPSQAGLLIADRSGPTGTGVSARYWNNTDPTVPQFTNTVATATVPVGPTPALSRIEPQINNSWPTPTSPSSALAPPDNTRVNSDYFVARYTANILPEYSQIYTFKGIFDRGGRLYVNGQLLFSQFTNSPTAGTYTGTIDLQAGKLYPVVFEYMARSGAANVQMLWASANQPEQVVPQNRLFPSAAPIILSSLELLLIKGAPVVNYSIVASGEPTTYSAANLPPNWTINTANGLISGSPNTAGEWDIPISATNANGTGSALLHLTVLATGGAITRDVWTGVPGSSVADIPLATVPTSTAPIALLETPQSAPDADNYGARIRGYLSAPLTGAYKFFLTADGAAELWISDDDDPVNSFKRTEVTAATGYREWTHANAGRSPLLWLTAGRTYFIEVRHKESVGTDHVSVGWNQPGQGGNDPGNATTPSEVVPGYALSPYVPPTSGGGQAALFFTTLTPQSGAATSASGNILVRLSADETQATLRINYSNLTSAYFGMHLHDDRIPNPPGGLNNVVCDLDQPGDVIHQADGSYLWPIEPRGGLSVADIVEGIKTGHNYFNVHSVNSPGGEIKGYLKLLEGAQTFTPPANPPSWADDHSDPNAAARFLTQGTFGVGGADADADGIPDSIESVQTLGYDGWINAEIGKPITQHYPYVFTNRNITDPDNSTFSGSLAFNSWWRNAVTAPDQLRQRVAFAFSQILVISENGVLDDRADTISDYYDTLLLHSFGNFRDLLEAATLHPSMGRYLDMLNNRKPSITTGRIPNENYAREILQLFSIGLNRQWPDGSLVLNAKGEPVPTYDQDVVVGFAHAFTGWGYNYAGGYRTTLPGTANWIDPMREVPLEHYTGPKRILNNVILPGLAVLGGVPLDPNASHTSTQYNNAAYQALAAQELDATHDAIFNHPNTGPFICRQLIQRLVTSTPSRGYIYRVTSKFNDDGSPQHVRGNMQAVIKAILLDYEARSSAVIGQQGYGKQREPVLRVSAVARAFPAPSAVTGTYSQTGNLITVAVTPAQTFANGNNVYLEFSGGTPSDPDDTAYSVISPSTAGNTTTFTVRPLSSETGATYTQSNATLNVAVGSDHTFNTTTNSSVYLDFTATTGAVPPDGLHTVTSVSVDQEDFTVPAPSAQRATYSQAATAMTITVPAGHSYVVDDSVQIDYVTGGGVSGAFTVTAVTGNTFTVTASDSATRTGNAHVILPANIAARTGTLVATREAYAVNRSGTVALTFSDWNMDDTDNDLNQTPMHAPTVFNFYEPDYSFPGVIAQAGLITPEFQLTSDTTVMRQVNFLYNGMFNDLHSTLGMSSFKGGARDVALDFRPWMGSGAGGLARVANANLPGTLNELSTLLTGGQMPAAALTIIQNYVQTLPLLTKVVTGTGNAGATRLTVANHGLTSGTNVTIAGITGGTFSPAINNNTTGFTITVLGPDTFSVPVSCTNAATVNLTGATVTPAGGSAAPITALIGLTTVNVATHGLTAGQSVTISGITGGTFTPSINGTFTIESATTNSFNVAVTRTNGTNANYTNAVATFGIGFRDLLRDRVRAAIHLIITSPDFTIQK